MKKITQALRHFFIPHRSNKYRAKALHIDSLAVYLVFIICLSLIWSQININNDSGDILGYATDVTTEKVFQLTNKEREQLGLDPLNYNPRLSRAAEEKAKDMFANNYWSHYGPDGATPWDFIIGSGYEYEYAGENLAKNFLFSDGVVQAWMDSPTHRENIVRSEYTDVGYAVVNGVLNGEETTLVVQMFGTPLNYGVDNVYAEENTMPDVAGSTTGENNKIEQMAKEESRIADQSIEKTSGEPVVSDKTTQEQMLGSAKQQTSFFGLFYNLKLGLLFLFFGIIALDLYLGLKFNVIRLSGKSLIHLMFLAFVIAGVYFLAKGAII